jgi:hypothetical protein
MMSVLGPSDEEIYKATKETLEYERNMRNTVEHRLAAYKAKVEPVLEAASKVQAHGLTISLKDIRLDQLIIDLSDALDALDAAKEERDDNT